MTRTAKDDIRKSFVESPDRGENYSAQEVKVSELQTIANLINQVADDNATSDQNIRKIVLLNDLVSEAKKIRLLLEEVTGIKL